MSTKHPQTILAPLTVIGLAWVMAVALAAATPETYYFFVFSNPVVGQEARYNKWYNEQHQLDVVSIPGFVTAQRFVMNDLPLYRRADLELPKYLVVYKMVTEDLEGVFKEVSHNMRLAAMQAPSLNQIQCVKGFQLLHMGAICYF